MTDVGDRCDAALREISERGFERADAEAALADLARHIGCKRLELDEQGAAETVDGDIDVTLLHLPHLPGLVAAVRLVSMDIRRYTRKLIEGELYDLPVLSYQELTPEITIQPLGRIEL